MVIVITVVDNLCYLLKHTSQSDNTNIIGIIHNCQRSISGGKRQYDYPMQTFLNYLFVKMQQRWQCYSSDLKMETVRSSKTLVPTSKPTQHQKPEQHCYFLVLMSYFVYMLLDVKLTFPRTVYIIFVFILNVTC